jgi:hypothetical protein
LAIITTSQVGSGHSKQTAYIEETISDAPDENKAENRGFSPDPHTIDACTEGMSTIEASSGKVIV